MAGQPAPPTRYGTALQLKSGDSRVQSSAPPSTIYPSGVVRAGSIVQRAVAAAGGGGVPGWAFADGNLNRNSAAATAAYQYICAFIQNPPVANLTIRWNNGSDTAVYMWFRDGIEAHYHPGAGQPGRIKYAGGGSLANHDLGLHISELPNHAGFTAFLAARIPAVRGTWV